MNFSAEVRSGRVHPYDVPAYLALVAALVSSGCADAHGRLERANAIDVTLVDATASDAMLDSASRTDAATPAADGEDAGPDTSEPNPGMREPARVCSGGEIGTMTELERMRGCEQLEGELRLSTAEISSLEALSSLRSIHGYLHIGASRDRSDPDSLPRSVLASLAGLEGLRSVSDFISLESLPITSLMPLAGLEQAGSFMLDHLDALSDLRGLENAHWRWLSLNQSAGLRSLEGLVLRESTDELIVNIDISQAPLLADISALRRVKRLSGLTLTDLPALTNLSGLQGIQRIDRLSIGKCDNLQDLTGLQDLAQVDSLSFTGNRQLRSLRGLALAQGPVSIWLGDDPVLSNIDGILSANVHECEDVRLVDLPALSSFAALQSVTKVRYLVIESCNGLQAFTGLEQLATVWGGTIKNNAALRSLHALAALTDARCLAIGGNGALPESEIVWLAQRTMIQRSAIDPALSPGACLP